MEHLCVLTTLAATSLWHAWAGTLRRASLLLGHVFFDSVLQDFSFFFYNDFFPWGYWNEKIASSPLSDTIRYSVSFISLCLSVSVSYRFFSVSLFFCLYAFSVSSSFCLFEFIVSFLFLCFLSFGYQILSVLLFFLFVCPFTINCIFCSLFSFNCVEFL